MSEWISVEDKLPDVATDTLLVVVDFGDKTVSDTDGFEYGRFSFWGGRQDVKVTYWMYLPEPPK